MGCCGGSSTQKVTLEELPKFTKTITVYGDYFCPDLRTILTCMQYSGCKYQFTEVDTLVGEHTEESYLEVNPTGQTPTITDGTTTVIGGYSNQLAFLASQNQSLTEKMYPRLAQAEIDTHMQWFNCILKPVVKKYTRMVIGSKAYGDEPSKPEQREEVWKEIVTLILPNMEAHLVEKQREYFCSDEDITIVDVQYYHIIKQITMLDQSRKITESRDFPTLAAWMNRVT